MIDVENCPLGTKIRQIQGVVDVKESGTMLLEVDGANGKRIMKLNKNLIVFDTTITCSVCHTSPEQQTWFYW